MKSKGLLKEDIERKQRIIQAININKSKIEELNTDRMSKTGVKWCKQVYRENIKRLKKELMEL